MLALVAFLIPVFENVFKDFNGKLPAITQISVDRLAPRDRHSGTC